MNRITYVVGVLFATAALMFTGCVGKKEIDEKKTVSDYQARGVYLDQIHPYNPKGCTLVTSIVFHGVNAIRVAEVYQYNAIDQAGQPCLLDSVGVYRIKGGVRVSMFCKIDSDKAKKITVKAEIYFNGTKTNITCGYRKITEAECDALNDHRVDWTYIDDIEKVQTDVIPIPDATEPKK